jgi:hypothetical protein
MLFQMFLAISKLLAIKFFESQNTERLVAKLQGHPSQPKNHMNDDSYFIIELTET